MKNWISLVLAVAVVLLMTRVLFAKPDGAEKARAREKIKQGAFLVDVRTPAEFSAGHHPSATNIPLQELQARIAEFGDTNREIVVYCRSGNRSGQAKKILEGAGYKDVSNGGSLSDVTREP
jgi:phage shock protein E